MNAFNRSVMLIIALLLIAVPVLLLLVGFDVLPADLFTGLSALRALDELSNFSFDLGARRIVTAVVGALVALVALILLLRELTFGHLGARSTVVDETPGRETRVTAQAVRRLAEGAAREAGASSPTCYLASEKRRYSVACNILAPRSQNITELATRTRDNIRRTLEEQQVPVRDVEVTVQGTAS